MKKGVSMVELIAVIVVMGIVAGIAVPTTISTINRTKKKACALSINAISTSCSYAIDFGETYLGNEEAVEEVFVQHGMTKTADRTYSGLCPSGGAYRYEIDADGVLTIECLHKDHSDVKKITSGEEAFNVIMDSINSSEELANKIKKSDTVIDSNAIKNDKTAIVREYLEDQGFDLSDSCYVYQLRYTKATDKVEFYYTELNLDGRGGQYVTAYRVVREADGTVTTTNGKVQVQFIDNEKQGTYYKVLGTTFKESK